MRECSVLNLNLYIKLGITCLLKEYRFIDPLQSIIYIRSSIFYIICLRPFLRIRIQKGQRLVQCFFSPFNFFLFFFVSTYLLLEKNQLQKLSHGSSHAHWCHERRKWNSKSFKKINKSSSLTSSSFSHSFFFNFLSKKN